MKRRYRCSLLPALRPGLAFLLALVFAGGAARAATFTVSNLNDSGPGSLRQAVLDANASPGADDVVFDPGDAGTITLSFASGEILITDSLFIHGPGAAALTVSGNNRSRIFHVESPAAAPIDVTLSGLTLTHGSSGSFTFGGAVLANGENLTILGSVISDSSAGDIEETGCGGNVAFAGTGGATLHIADSTLTGGDSAGPGISLGGGNLCVTGGTLILERSTLSEGQAGAGGGLYLQALTGDSTISSTTISGNEASSTGGGIVLNGSSGVTVTIDSSTISGNTAGLSGTAPGNGFGGGVYLGNSNLRIVNSTISGNLATGWGGGIAAQGSLLLRLTTVTGNTANMDGGSILVYPTPIELDHAIVANGTPEDLAQAPGLGRGGPLTVTANYSLVEAPGPPGGVVLAGAHNLVGVDPLLGPLANNGGPTLTHLPLPGSPAVDAGDPAIPSPPPADQRGSQRIIGAAVDLGAVEVGGRIIEVPTLSSFGVAVLSMLLFTTGVWRLRRPASGSS